MRRKGTFIANKHIYFFKKANFFTFALCLGRKCFYFGPQQTRGFHSCAPEFPYRTRFPRLQRRAAAAMVPVVAWEYRLCRNPDREPCTRVPLQQLSLNSARGRAGQGDPAAALGLGRGAAWGCELRPRARHARESPALPGSSGQLLRQIPALRLQCALLGG